MTVLFVLKGITLEEKSRDCNHPSVMYFEKESAWKCMKCNEKLVTCGINEFRLFCHLSGKEPKSLMVWVICLH